MNSPPKPWIAAVLGLACGPLGFAYVGRPRWALRYLLIGFSVGVADSIHPLGVLSDIFLVVLTVAGAVLAFQVARTVQTDGRRWYSRWYGLTGITVLAIVSLVGFRLFLYEPFRVPSSAMEPSVPRGSFILVEKIGYGQLAAYGLKFGSREMSAQIKRGQMIAFDYPLNKAQMYVKRVVGVPGDLIQYRGVRLLVNGVDVRIGTASDNVATTGLAPGLQRVYEALDGTSFETLVNPKAPAFRGEPHDYPLRERCTYFSDGVECRVPANNYFVLGDNRDNSVDSRYFGFVRSDLILGKVIKMF